MKGQNDKKFRGTPEISAGGSCKEQNLCWRTEGWSANTLILVVLLKGNCGHFGIKPGGEGESFPELDTKVFVYLPSPAMAAGS